MADAPAGFEVVGPPAGFEAVGSPEGVEAQPDEVFGELFGADEQSIPNDIFGEGTREGARASVGAALEGAPIIGPALLSIGERLRAVLKDRPLSDIEAETLKLFEENPRAVQGGRIAGSVIATAPLGAGSVGKALFGSALRAATTGATISGADTAVRGGGVKDIATSAAFGGATGAGSVLIGRGLVHVGKGLSVARSQIATTISGASDDLIGQGRALYRQADAVGVRLRAKTFDAMVGRIVKAAKPAGDLADDLLAKNTPKAAAAIKWLDGLKGREPTLSELDQVRQFLGDVAGSIDPGERRLGMMMKDALDDALSELKASGFVTTELQKGVSALEAARGLWRRGKILETMAGAAAKAELANQPLGAAIQRETRNLLNRRKFVATLTAQEKKMLREVARADVDTALGIIGQMRTLLGAPAVGAGAFGLTGDLGTAGLVTGATAAAGAGARGIRSVLARQRLLDATEALRAGTAVALPNVGIPAAAAVGAVTSGTPAEAE